MKPTNLRNRLLPKGTLRDRAFSVLEREGLIPLLKRGSKLLFGKLQQFFILKTRYSTKVENSLPPSGIHLRFMEKPDVICFSVIPWNLRFQRPQQLLSQFARDGHRVFYLTPNFGGFQNPGLRVDSIPDRIYELTLPGDRTLAIYRDDLTDPTFSHAVHALEEFIQQTNIIEAYCLVHHPFWLPLVRLLKEHYNWKVIYDCMDDITGFDVTHNKMAARENELVLQSDLVIAASRLLYRRVHEWNPNCILIPNATDYDHFSHLPARAESPLAEIQRPVIGYYGAISGWFDGAAVQHAARIHPEWSFVLIGDTWGGNVKKLEKLDNVYLLGEKRYQELPSYVSGFDVCTIPFLRIPLTEATNPVKLFEYLSTGKPIVATLLPELEPYKDIILVYSEPDQFVHQLEYAIKSDSRQLFEKRQAIARENTWSTRYQSLKQSINKL